MTPIALLLSMMLAASPAPSTPGPAHPTSRALDASSAARDLGEARWTARLEALDSVRSRAFTDADPRLLGRVYPEGSPLARTDAAVVRAYASRGVELSAVRFSVLDLRVLRQRPDRVVLRIVDRLDPVRVRVGRTPWQTLPRDRPTQRRITLARTADGWRIATVRRLAG